MATFERINEPTETAMALTIHVVPRVAEELLDEGDLDDAGFCTVDGVYPITIDIPEEHKARMHNIALEAFHALCSVYEPDDFRFIVSTANPKMDPASRRDLGHWKFIDPNPPEKTTIIQVRPEDRPQLRQVGA
jgi:hypothetical protein